MSGFIHFKSVSVNVNYITHVVKSGEYNIVFYFPSCNFEILVYPTKEDRDSAFVDIQKDLQKFTDGGNENDK